MPETLERSLEDLVGGRPPAATPKGLVIWVVAKSEVLSPHDPVPRNVEVPEQSLHSETPTGVQALPEQIYYLVEASHAVTVGIQELPNIVQSLVRKSAVELVHSLEKFMQVDLAVTVVVRDMKAAS
jgi:hypothetical protein